MWWLKRESYAGKNVVIAGGSTGIGLALAQEIVRRGANVVLIARTKSKLDQAVEFLMAIAGERRADTHIRGYAADVCNSQQVVQNDFSCRYHACQCRSGKCLNDFHVY